MSGDAPREPTRRFSTRAEHYARYRPGYPASMVDHLCRELALSPADVIADVGSGTGILTRIFLERGNRVHAVEPNRQMRLAAESALGSFPGFRSVDGSAESTGLPDRSVDCVMAAQAFHWFRADEARDEFRRILSPAGQVVLIWNRRRQRGPFLEAYEQMLQQYGTDYGVVDYRKLQGSGAISRFFGARGFATASFDNDQQLDLEGLRGRLLSSSYAPLPGQARHEPMMQELSRIFHELAENGRVRLAYRTEIYRGRPGG